MSAGLELEAVTVVCPWVSQAEDVAAGVGDQDAGLRRVEWVSTSLVSVLWVTRFCGTGHCRRKWMSSLLQARCL